MSSCCCRNRRLRVSGPDPEQLEKREPAANPELSSGVDLIYLGGGGLSLVGESSGERYHVSARQRHFTVHVGDSDAILRNRNFMRRP
jgi:hypothetical protein